jgi:type IV pilus assembly protein PilC
MKRFKYKAKDQDGKVITGEVEATNDKQAARLLRQKNLTIISITPKKDIPFNFIKKYKERVTQGDITNFTRQLATMVNAGLPLTEAILILRNQSKGRMQTIIAEILSDVEEGHPLSASMGKHTNIFSKTYIALIKSGEVGGVLDQVLVRLADTLERQQEFRGKVKSAMIYPVIIVVGMVAVAFIMLIFVVPKLTELYDQFDAELPIATKLLIVVSTFMSKFWPFMIIGVIFLLYLFRLYRGTKNGRRKVDDMMLKIPLVGDLQKEIILADLTRTLSLMVGSGVSILESLNISAEVVGNTIMSEALIDISSLVEKGFPVAFSFAKHSDSFPPILSQMISVGEETGKMDEVLAKVSHVFETESDQKLKAITSAVEPIILIVLGVGVAFLVISIIMPIYNLTTQL